MKKTLTINIIIALLFFACDPLLNCLGEWADIYNLGAEIVLGMLTPLLFGFFVVMALCLTVFSVIKAIAKKDVKQLIPISIFAIGLVTYLLVSNSNSFWIRFVNYYFNV